MTRGPNLSLRARFAALLLVALVPLAGIGTSWLFWGIQNEGGLVEQEAEAAARSVAGELGQRLFATRETLAVLAVLPIVEQADHAACTRLFRDLLASSPHLANLGLVRSDGTLLASAVPPPGNISLNLKDEEWFVRALRDRRAVLGGHQISRMTGSDIAIAAHPVGPPGGEPRLLLTAALRLEAIESALRTLSMPPELTWRVVDGQGIVLLENRSLDGVGRPLRPSRNAILAQHVVLDTSWLVAVAIPAREALTRAWSPLIRFGLPSAGVILVTLLLGFAIARGTWRPLKQLIDGVRRVGAGQSDPPLPTGAAGEVGEVARVFRETLGILTRRQRELAALVEAHRSLTSNLDLARTLEVIVDRAKAISGAPSARLFLLDDRTRLLTCRVGRKGEQEIVIRVGESFSGQVAATRTAVAVPDCRGDARVKYPDLMEQSGHISYLGLPVSVGETLYGVLVFNTPTPHVYTDAEIDFLSAFAQQAAIAIDNARLFHQEQERREQLDAVRVVAEEITRELDLERLLALIVRRAVELIGASTGTVRLWDAVQERLVPMGWTGSEQARLGAMPLRLGEGVAGAIAARREGLIVNDFPASPYATPDLSRAGHTAVLGEPLMYRDRLIGVITVDNLGTEKRFGDADQRILRLFASQVAVAIENARLFRAEQEGRKQLDIVRAAGEEITRELDLDALLMLLIRRALELTGASAGVVRLWEESSQRLVPRGWVGDQDRFLALRLGEGLAGAAAQRRKGLIANAFRTSPFATPELLRVSDLTAAMAEPLLYRDRFIGVISVDNGGTRKQFTAEDQSILRLFGSQAAIAIENARLYAEVKTSYERLKQAQDELIRTEKLRGLGQMAAGIAHDLNNTLATVLGQTELLRLRVKDADVLQTLALLHTAVTDGAAVVRRLQDFARQRSDVPLAPCDLAAIVRETLDITRPRWRDEAQRRNATIRVDLEFPPDLPSVLGNAPEIREALTNLLFNAVDAMPQGGVLRLAARRAEATDADRTDAELSTAPRALVELEVADTGVGIPQEMLTKIFEPFFTTKGVRGTGLGLSVVYGIMERHGGAIDARSTPGRGTVFTLRFQAAGAVSSDSPAVERHQVVSRRVLLVDDDAAVRQTVAALLAAAGHRVIEAESGGAGLERLAESSVDVVVTDLGMPDLSGWEVARRVKRMTPGLPVLLLTGWGEHLGAEGDDAAFVDRVLGKPIHLATILTAISELTGRADPA